MADGNAPNPALPVNLEQGKSNHQLLVEQSQAIADLFTHMQQHTQDMATRFDDLAKGFDKVGDQFKQFLSILYEVQDRVHELELDVIKLPGEVKTLKVLSGLETIPLDTSSSEME